MKLRYSHFMILPALMFSSLHAQAMSCLHPSVQAEARSSAFRKLVAEPIVVDLSLPDADLARNLQFSGWLTKMGLKLIPQSHELRMRLAAENNFGPGVYKGVLRLANIDNLSQSFEIHAGYLQRVMSEPLMRLDDLVRLGVIKDFTGTPTIEGLVRNSANGNILLLADLGPNPGVAPSGVLGPSKAFKILRPIPEDANTIFEYKDVNVVGPADPIVFVRVDSIPEYIREQLGLVQ